MFFFSENGTPTNAFIVLDCANCIRSDIDNLNFKNTEIAVTQNSGLE